MFKIFGHLGQGTGNITTVKPVFVCVERLWPSQPIRVMSSMVSLPNHIFSLLTSKRLTSICAHSFAKN